MGQFCEVMLDPKINDPMTKLANVLLRDVNGACMTCSYNQYVKEFSAPDWNSVTQGQYIRNWFHQTCFEFGFFQSASSNNHPFGQTVPVEFYSQLCQDVFGSAYSYAKLQSSVQDINQNFGGISYQGTNVLFVNGDFDPWHALSYTDLPPNPFTNVLLIHGTGHCADFKGTQPSNPPQLNQAIETAKRTIARYLR